MKGNRPPQRFLKPCRRCDQPFRPKTSSGRLCKDCIKKALIAGQKKTKELNKLRLSQPKDI
jgi:hypothetical protein